MEAGSEHRTAGAADWRPVLGILLGIYIGYAGWELLTSGKASASPLSFALWAVSVSNLSLIQSSAVAGAARVPRRLAWTAAMAAGRSLPGRADRAVAHRCGREDVKPSRKIRPVTTARREMTAARPGR